MSPDWCVSRTARFCTWLRETAFPIGFLWVFYTSPVWGLAASYFIASCFVDDHVAIHAAENAGFTNARVYDHSMILGSWFAGCGEDALAYKVTATNPTGKNAQIVVCSGLFIKAATIRSK